MLKYEESICYNYLPVYPLVHCQDTKAELDLTKYNKSTRNKNNLFLITKSEQDVGHKTIYTNRILKMSCLLDTCQHIF